MGSVQSVPRSSPCQNGTSPHSCPPSATHHPQDEQHHQQPGQQQLFKHGASAARHRRESTDSSSCGSSGSSWSRSSFGSNSGRSSSSSSNSSSSSSSSSSSRRSSKSSASSSGSSSCSRQQNQPPLRQRCKQLHPYHHLWGRPLSPLPRFSQRPSNSPPSSALPPAPSSAATLPQTCSSATSRSGPVVATGHGGVSGCSGISGMERLPRELVVDVLSRLPRHSWPGLRRVCRAWRDDVGCPDMVRARRASGRAEPWVFHVEWVVKGRPHLLPHHLPPHPPASPSSSSPPQQQHQQRLLLQHRPSSLSLASASASSPPSSATSPPHAEAAAPRVSSAMYVHKYGLSSFVLARLWAFDASEDAAVSSPPSLSLSPACELPTSARCSPSTAVPRADLRDGTDGEISGSSSSSSSGRSGNGGGGGGRWYSMGCLPAMPGISHASQVVAFGPYLVFLGGSGVTWAADGSAVPSPVPYAWRYNPLTGRARRLPDMLTPRVNFAAAVVGGRLIVAGGSGWRNVPLRSAEVFDPRANAWAPLPDLHVARRCCIGAEVHGRMWVMSAGGLCDSRSHSAEVLDPGDWGQGGARRHSCEVALRKSSAGTDPLAVAEAAGAAAALTAGAPEPSDCSSVSADGLLLASATAGRKAGAVPVASGLDVETAEISSSEDAESAPLAAAPAAAHCDSVSSSTKVLQWTLLDHMLPSNLGGKVSTRHAVVAGRLVLTNRVAPAQHDVMVYDEASNTWRMAGRLPVAGFQGFGVVGVGETLFVEGGVEADEEEGEVVLGHGPGTGGAVVTAAAAATAATEEADLVRGLSSQNTWRTGDEGHGHGEHGYHHRGRGIAAGVLSFCRGQAHSLHLHDHHPPSTLHQQQSAHHTQPSQIDPVHSTQEQQQGQEQEQEQRQHQPQHHHHHLQQQQRQQTFKKLGLLQPRPYMNRFLLLDGQNSQWQPCRQRPDKDGGVPRCSHHCATSVL